MAEQKAVICPNCQKPAIQVGNEITCENCDATFVITKKHEAKVKEFGQIQDHENRIRKLEQFIPEDSAKQQEIEQEPEEDL